MTWFEQLMVQRRYEEQQAIARGELVKKETYNNHRNTAKYEVYNAPAEWTEKEVIDYCDRNCFGGYAHKAADGVWYIECDTD